MTELYKDSVRKALHRATRYGLTRAADLLVWLFPAEPDKKPTDRRRTIFEAGDPVGYCAPPAGDAEGGTSSDRRAGIVSPQLTAAAAPDQAGKDAMIRGQRDRRAATTDPHERLNEMGRRVAAMQSDFVERVNQDPSILNDAARALKVYNEIRAIHGLKPDVNIDVVKWHTSIAERMNKQGENDG
jgi:hypothetical protein